MQTVFPQTEGKAPFKPTSFTNVVRFCRLKGFVAAHFQTLERAVSENVTRAACRAVAFCEGGSRLPFLRSRHSRYSQNAPDPWDSPAIRGQTRPSASPIRCILHSLCNSAPARCPFPDLGKINRHERTQGNQRKLRLTKHSTKYYIKPMKDLMTRTFRKWVSKQPVRPNELTEAIAELETGIFDAALGGHLYKKRIRFKGRGKSGSGRTIICYKKDKLAIFIHGFAKNEKSNLSTQELTALKELAKILTSLTAHQIETAIKNGDFKEVKT